jgi:peptide/nickel transport system ATP-binding protein
MKAAFKLSLLLITHDLGVIAGTADRVAVMYAGRIVETGPVRAIFREPAHPYTRGLLASMPGGAPGRRLKAIEGSVPLMGSLPPGCAFNPRCPDRFDPCTIDPPPDYRAGPEQAAKCYLHDPAVRPAPPRSAIAPPKRGEGERDSTARIDGHKPDTPGANAAR